MATTAAKHSLEDACAIEPLRSSHLSLWDLNVGRFIWHFAKASEQDVGREVSKIKSPKTHLNGWNQGSKESLVRVATSGGSSW